jgi:predicted small lipoprotein YifL
VHPLRRLAAAAALLAALAGCFGKKDSPTRPPADQAAPDFSLVDQNPNSATAGKAVSPRQYLGKVSAWYFGHAT